MKPVYGKTKTDSLAACVASLLEVELEEIPDFFSADASHSDPLAELENFLHDAKWVLIPIASAPDGGTCIAIMSYGENNLQYGVVWQDGVLHDPRPEKGSTGGPIAFLLLAPLDIQDYVRTCHNEASEHAYWSQVEPGTEFFVWSGKDLGQAVYREYAFFADEQPWFRHPQLPCEAQTFQYATPARSII